MRDGVVFGFGAAAVDQLGEVGHHRPDRLADGLQRAGDAALGGVGRDDGFGPAVELSAVLFRHAQVVRDDHRRQRLEQLGDDVAAAVGEQPLDAFDDEFADLGLHRLDLSRGEPAGHQLAELGVHRRILHHHRRIVLQPNHFQLAVVDGQALRRRERLVVARGRPDVGVPGQHVVVVLGLAGRHHVVHRVVVAQRAVHRPRVGPRLGGRQTELRRVRQSRRHVLLIRQTLRYVNYALCLQMWHFQQRNACATSSSAYASVSGSRRIRRR